MEAQLARWCGQAGCGELLGEEGFEWGGWHYFVCVNYVDLRQFSSSPFRRK
jgi:hypothetical protein